MAEIRHCCASMTEAVDKRQIAKHGESYHMLGCCGSCYTIKYIVFCPFCGKTPPKEERKDGKRS